MHCLFQKPAPPLDEFVDVLWLVQDYEPAHFLERLLPSGTVELVINLEDDALRSYRPHDLILEKVTRGPILAGPQSAVTILDTGQQRHIMGAHFRPGGVQALVNLPATEFAHQDVELEHLWGREALHLRERLEAAATAQGKLDFLETTLRERLIRNQRQDEHPAVVRALQLLEQGAPELAIGDLAGILGLSARRFIELFSRQVGLTPKAYARLRRFQSVLTRIHQGTQKSTPPRDWCQLALDHGYYDQAHFNRDFRAFSGLTPSAYVALRPAEMNHVPIPVSAYPLPAGA